MEKPIRKIIMFSNLYPPVVSGSSTNCSGLASELVKRGCEVIVITAKINRNLPDQEIVDGVYIYRLPAIILPRMSIALKFPWLNFTLFPSNQSRVDKIMEEHQPDIIHLHNHMFDLAFSAVRAARKYKKPLVITIHTIIKHANRFYNLFLFPADRFFLKNTVIKRADLLICPDITIQNYVTEAFQKSNFHLVPYGITKLPQPDPDRIATIRRKYHLDGQIVVLSLGHIHDIRNRKDLIEALPLILKVIPSFKLLLVGSVSTRSTEQIAIRLGVSQAVIFTGPIDHSEVSAYLAISDIEAHWLNQDTVENTTLGIASLEAMAEGKTVISTANHNAYGDGVLRNMENVILVKPGKPDELAKLMIEIISNKEKRHKIGSEAEKTIQTHFAWEKVCENTLDAYHLARDNFYKAQLTA